MKKLDVVTVGHALYLCEAHGWNEELVLSVIGAGRPSYSTLAKGWTLPLNEGIATFDEQRLRELTRDVLRYGKPLSERERDHCLKYYSQVGVFEFGDRADYYGRYGRDHRYER